MSRIKFTIKNVFFGNLSSVISMLLAFISRTVFINILGTVYLGVNGLFTNVLGVLSFAELGIGSAMNFALYKPVAQKNERKIIALMQLYKKAYRAVAIIVMLIGLCLVPFLDLIIKDPGNVGNIKIYYLIFLFNTVTSYFVSYKFSLVNAEQKNYIMTNINMIVAVITTIAQIIVMEITKNFMFYLLTAAGIGLLQKIFISRYLNKLYPCLKQKEAIKLPAEEMKEIKKNVGGLVWHKIGEISVHQTDNIIISAFINVVTVGLVSNYTMIQNYVVTFLNNIFSGVTSSLGNLVATESQEKQFFIFKVYNFVNFWLFGFCSICLFILFTPFITLWIGSDKLIDDVSLTLMCVNFYFMGQRCAFLNYKTAFGVFYDDKFVVLQAAIINLVVSILAVNLIGLPGVYLGTVITGLYQSIRRPIIAYGRITGDKVSNYFLMLLKYFFVTFAAAVMIYVVSRIIIKKLTVLSFILLTIVILLFVNLWFWILFHKSEEFQYIIEVIKSFKKGKGKI